MAEVNILADHYYQERIPNVVITEGERASLNMVTGSGRELTDLICPADPHNVRATLVPSHVHHVCFEILKNAFKASIEKARKKNANQIPPVEVSRHHRQADTPVTRRHLSE